MVAGPCIIVLHCCSPAHTAGSRVKRSGKQRQPRHMNSCCASAAAALSKFKFECILLNADHQLMDLQWRDSGFVVWPRLWRAGSLPQRRKTYYTQRFHEQNLLEAKCGK